MFYDFFWHDGLLIKVNFDFEHHEECTITLILELYESNQSEARERYSLKLYKVTSFNGNLDTVQLSDNVLAGNIIDAHLRERDHSKLKAVRFFFTDGYFDVTHEYIEIKKLDIKTNNQEGK